MHSCVVVRLYGVTLAQSSQCSVWSTWCLSLCLSLHHSLSTLKQLLSVHMLIQLLNTYCLRGRSGWQRQWLEWPGNGSAGKEGICPPGSTPGIHTMEGETRSHKWSSDPHFQVVTFSCPKGYPHISESHKKHSTMHVYEIQHALLTWVCWRMIRLQLLDYLLPHSFLWKDIWKFVLLKVLQCAVTCCCLLSPFILYLICYVYCWNFLLIF